MLDPRSFEKHAANVKLGGRLRTNHDCGPGRTLLLSRDDDGLAAYCFRCGEPGFIKDERTLAERIAALAKARAADVEVVRPELPEPRERDVQQWPKEARVWCHKAGLSSDDLTRLGWYYHVPSSRVIIPVVQGGEVTFWCGRGFNPNQPKVLNSPASRVGVVAEYGDGPVVCITEDALSAAKVGMVTEAWALLGTSMDATTMLRLVGRKVALMLDDDPAGRKGAARAARALGLLGVDTHQIYFGRDPKLVSRGEIYGRLAAHWPEDFGEPTL